MNVDTDLGPFVSLLLNSLLLSSLVWSATRGIYTDHNDLPQDLVRQLRIIILLCENMEEFCHWFREVFEVRQILDD